MPFYLLANKTAAITGGTTGIGRAIALEYIKESLVSEAKAVKDKDEKAGRLIDVAGDISKPETGANLVEEAVKEFGRLDIFVSNAGVCQFAEFLE
jgi:L-rhamnose 1-dehydrogenase